MVFFLVLLQPNLANKKQPNSTWNWATSRTLQNRILDDEYICDYGNGRCVVNWHSCFFSSSKCSNITKIKIMQPFSCAREWLANHNFLYGALFKYEHISLHTHTQTQVYIIKYPLISLKVHIQHSPLK